MPTFVPNPAGLAELLVGTRGVVATDTYRKTMKVTTGAKRRCPVDKGRLRSSIRGTLEHDSKGVYGKVGTEVEYALAVHEGHKEFTVKSTRGPGTALAFSDGGGGTVFVGYPNEVTIPATKGRPFLKDALGDIAGL